MSCMSEMGPDRPRARRKRRDAIAVPSSSQSPPAVIDVASGDEEKHDGDGKAPKSSPSVSVPVPQLTCTLCGIAIPEPTMTEHVQSTLHLFKRKNLCRSKHVLLGEENKGYQMLERMGWNEDEGRGLGKHSQGAIEPVRTVLKRDVRGLGAPPLAPASAVPRVTHFPPVVEGHTRSNTATIMRAVGTLPEGPLTSAEKRRRKSERKQAEAAAATERSKRAKKYHVELSSDLPDELAALLS